MCHLCQKQRNLDLNLKSNFLYKRQTTIMKKHVFVFLYAIFKCRIHSACTSDALKLTREIRKSGIEKQAQSSAKSNVETRALSTKWKTNRRIMKKKKKKNTRACLVFRCARTHKEKTPNQTRKHTHRESYVG